MHEWHEGLFFWQLRLLVQPITHCLLHRQNRWSKIIPRNQLWPGALLPVTAGFRDAALGQGSMRCLAHACDAAQQLSPGADLFLPQRACAISGSLADNALII